MLIPTPDDAGAQATYCRTSPTTILSHAVSRDIIISGIMFAKALKGMTFSDIKQKRAAEATRYRNAERQT